MSGRATLILRTAGDEWREPEPYERPHMPVQQYHDYTYGLSKPHLRPFVPEDTRIPPKPERRTRPIAAPTTPKKAYPVAQPVIQPRRKRYVVSHPMVMMPVRVIPMRHMSAGEALEELLAEEFHVSGNDSQ